MFEACMLAAAEKELGSLRERPDLKAELRGTFRFTLTPMPICDRPSESVRRLLALMREDGCT